MVDDINYEEFENLQAVSELLKICSLVDKSSSIIDHIRSFSKKSGFFMKSIDLNKAILNTKSLIGQQLKKNNIEINFELRKNIPKIYGDNISIEQLIVNMILNSKDAIIEKQQENPDLDGNIRISTSHTNGMIKMVIQDNGIGIPDVIKEKIFLKGYKEIKGKKGMGLGLSLVTKIIELYNGKIWVEDRVNGNYTQGSNFIFLIPEEI